MYGPQPWKQMEGASLFLPQNSIHMVACVVQSIIILLRDASQWWESSGAAKWGTLLGNVMTSLPGKPGMTSRKHQKLYGKTTVPKEDWHHFQVPLQWCCTITQQHFFNIIFLLLPARATAGAPVGNFQAWFCSCCSYHLSVPLLSSLPSLFSCQPLILPQCLT